MAGDPTYKKYGGFGTPDMRALVAGQKAVGEGFKEALSGVDDLLTQTEDIYKKNNTLNMQEYLQNKIKEQGLRAEPLDKTAIQKQFGSMVDMEQLENTFTTAKQQVEMDAVNDVGQRANQVFFETGDVLQARKTLEQGLKEDYNATPTQLGRAMQSWTDANAVAIKDMEIQAERDREIGYSNVRADVRSGLDGLQAIEARVLELPKHEQAEARRLWTDQHEKDKELTQTQIDSRDFYVNKLSNSIAVDIGQIEGEVAREQARLASLENYGVRDYALETAETISKTLGGSAKNAIRDKLDNSWQQLFGLGVGPKFDALHKELTEDLGVSDAKADAILIQAFNAEYNGDGGFFSFKGMSNNEIEAAKKKARRLAAEERAKLDSSNRLTELRTSLVDVEKQGLQRVADFRRQLNQTGQNRRLGVEGTSTIEDEGLAYFNQKIDQKRSQLGGNKNNTSGTDSQNYPELPSDMVQKQGSVETQYGLPSGYMGRLTQLESSNKLDAIHDVTKASGPYQMLPSVAKEFGVDPMDPLASTEAIGKLTERNKKVLTKNLGREPTEAELYLAHVQGADGASRLLANPDALATSLVSKDAVIHNRGREDMKAGEFASIFMDKYDKKANATPKDEVEEYRQKIIQQAKDAEEAERLEKEKEEAKKAEKAAKEEELKNAANGGMPAGSTQIMSNNIRKAGQESNFNSDWQMDLIGNVASVAAKYNPLTGPVLYAGNKAKEKLTQFRDWAQSGAMNSRPETLAKTDEIPAEDTVKKVTGTKALETKLEKGTFKITDLVGKEGELTPSIVAGLSKLPATESMAQNYATQLKNKHKKAGWPQVIEQLRKGNPALADMIAEILEVG